MTIRQNVRNGAPCWVDLMSSDPEKSKAFYGELLGWTAEEPNPDFGGYTSFQKDGERVAGLMQAQTEMGVSDVWSVYLCVDDAAASVRFYESVFGWKSEVVSDEPDFRYALLEGMPDGEGAGIMDASGFLPVGVPSHWSVYFQVPNAEDALARTEQLGGAIVMPAEPTPYGVLATAADSTGAIFKLRADA